MKDGGRNSFLLSVSVRVDPWLQYFLRGLGGLRGSFCPFPEEDAGGGERKARPGGGGGFGSGGRGHSARVRRCVDEIGDVFQAGAAAGAGRARDRDVRAGLQGGRWGGAGP